LTRSLKVVPEFSQHTKIKNANDVKSLCIYIGKSTRIFSGIGEAFNNLEVLWVHDKSLKFIDRTNFAYMFKLQKLELLDKDRIEFIAKDSFWQLPSLKSLNLFKCQIRELPKNLLAYSSKLEILGAAFNNIKHLHRDFFKYNPEIAEIDFRNNQLQIIDADFTVLPKIIELSMDYNDCIDATYSIKSPNLSTMKSLKQLQLRISLNCKFFKRYF
jgi:Leucine-rich repeat (LRR) protein